jgi:hypothetical protein
MIHKILSFFLVVIFSPFSSIFADEKVGYEEVLQKEPLKFVKALTQKYDPLTSFIECGGRTKMFEVILSDIHESLQNELQTTKKQKKKLNRVFMKRKGLSMFALSSEHDSPAVISVTRHRRNSQEITINKPIIQDEIDLFGTKYARLRHCWIEIRGGPDGIQSMSLSFSVKARKASEVKQRIDISDGYEFVYYGSYTEDPDWKFPLRISGFTNLMQYNRSNIVIHKYDGISPFKGPERLLKKSFDFGESKLSDRSTRQFLNIMHLIAFYGLDQTENGVYKDLLLESPLRINKTHQKRSSE